MREADPADDIARLKLRYTNGRLLSQDLTPECDNDLEREQC
jgi:hypothetical protein